MNTNVAPYFSDEPIKSLFRHFGFDCYNLRDTFGMTRNDRWRVINLTTNTHVIATDAATCAEAWRKAGQLSIHMLTRFLKDEN